MSDIFRQIEKELLMLQSHSFPQIVAGFTTKHGGVSKGAFATFNLGLHVGDDPLLFAAIDSVWRICCNFHLNGGYVATKYMMFTLKR